MSLENVPQMMPFWVAEDPRGSFHKVFPLEGQASLANIAEIFWSRSKKGVVRGMHLQTSSFGGVKIVYVLGGKIADFCVNVSSDSCEKGTVFFNQLSENGMALVVPKGFAHGFQALEEGTIVGYATDHFYSPDHESGFNPLSHPEIKWPLEVSQISDRDRSLPYFDRF